MVLLNFCLLVIGVSFQMILPGKPSVLIAREKGYSRLLKGTVIQGGK